LQNVKLFGAENRNKMPPGFRLTFKSLVFLLTVLLFVMPLADRAMAGPHLVFDYKTGRVFSQSDDAFDRWYPASLTKMMTAYTVFREVKDGRLSMLSPVKISANARSEPPSKMGFPVDTVLNMDAAIKIILVKSANDVATAIAESAGGSVEAFTALMNKYAREIGMTNSNFVNAHGLHDERQYTSAYDLGILAQRIYSEFPKQSAYFSIPAIKVGKKTMQNHNALIQRYPGTIGMKTGFICSAGLNIVVSAKVRGKNLIAVVLGGESGRERNIKAAQLLSSASARSITFGLPKIDALKPKRPVRQPVDMREPVCGKKKKTADPTVHDDFASNLFAVKKPTLDELEAKYLLAKGTNTRVVPIVLGNATGPDPFYLVTPASALALQSDALDEGGPEEIFDELDAPAGMVSSAEIVTPEIFRLSGGVTVTVPIARPIN